MLFVSLFHFRALNSHIRNERGQGLIEYLVIVALMGVATIAIVRVMGQTVEAKFGNIAHALRADGKTERVDSFEQSYTKKKDLGNFIEGAGGPAKDAGGAQGRGSDAPQ